MHSGKSHIQDLSDPLRVFVKLDEAIQHQGE